MSLGKLPGIKGLVSGSQGKRRIKSDLSVDMISPPLGDFRHTMHVGRGGDVFGDTSFLSNHGGTAGGNGSPDSATSGGFFSRTFRQVRRTPARPHYGSRDLSPPPPPISPIIKNAISLPQLNIDASNGCLQRALFPSSPSSPGDISYSYGMQSGFLTLPRPSRTDRQLQDSSKTYSPEPQYESFPDEVSFSLGRSDSMTSFTVDLGPSLMSEVFAMIDSTICGLDTNNSAMEDEPEELAAGTPATDTCSAVELAPQLDLNGRESLGSPRWEDDGGSTKRAMPDVVVFTAREEPGIEPERFQRAADVLARHYGGSGVFNRQQQTEHRDHQNLGFECSTMAQKRAPYAYPEEEDEIKV